MSLMAAMAYHNNFVVKPKSRNQKTELTPKQAKARDKSKKAKQARRKQSKRK